MGTTNQYATFSNWLLLVASLRLLSVFLGYWYPRQLFGRTLVDELFTLANVEPNKKKTDVGKTEFTGLTGRSFAAWTAVTCSVCIMTALNPTNVPLLQLTMTTFFIALVYFGLELHMYKTVSLGTVTRPFFFAIVSVIWCSFELKRQMTIQGY